MQGIIFHNGFLQQRHLYAAALLQIHYGEDNIDILPIRRADFSKDVLKDEYFLFDVKFNDEDCRALAPCAYYSVSQLWNFLGPKKFDAHEVHLFDKKCAKLVDADKRKIKFKFNRQGSFDDNYNEQLESAYNIAWSVVREAYEELGRFAYP